MICKSQEEHVQLKWILRWWTMFSEHSSRFRISNAKIIRILTTTNISFLVMFKCLKWVGWSVQRVIYFDLKLDSVRWIIVISGYHFIDQARMKWLLNYRILNYKIVDHSISYNACVYFEHTNLNHNWMYTNYESQLHPFFDLQVDRTMFYIILNIV